MLGLETQSGTLESSYSTPTVLTLVLPQKWVHLFLIGRTLSRLLSDGDSECCPLPFQVSWASPAHLCPHWRVSGGWHTQDHSGPGSFSSAPAPLCSGHRLHGSGVRGGQDGQCQSVPCFFSSLFTTKQRSAHLLGENLIALHPDQGAAPALGPYTEAQPKAPFTFFLVPTLLVTTGCISGAGPRREQGRKDTRLPLFWSNHHPELDLGSASGQACRTLARKNFSGDWV